MTIEKFIFYAFSGLLLFAAVRVITARNPVHSALYLVLAFFTAAVIWLLLEAEFLALALILVYVGAVMVLFLFVVMMLDINTAEMRAGFTRYLPLGLVVALLVVVEIITVVASRKFGLEFYPAPEPAAEGFSNVQAIGSVLYTEYVLPFELAAVILLVAIVAAIALTFRRREGIRYQDPGEQVRVRRADRVRLVDMPSRPREEDDDAPEGKE